MIAFGDFESQDDDFLIADMCIRSDARDRHLLAKCAELGFDIEDFDAVREFEYSDDDAWSYLLKHGPPKTVVALGNLAHMRYANLNELTGCDIDLVVSTCEVETECDFECDLQTNSNFGFPKWSPPVEATKQTY